MRKRRSTTVPKKNPNWVFADEYQLSPRVLLVPGTKFKVRGEYDQTFVFVHYVRNIVLNTDWIDCICIETKEHRAFRPERVTKRIK